MSGCSGGDNGDERCGACPVCVTMGYGRDSIKERFLEVRAMKAEEKGERLEKRVSELEAENAKLKTLIAVAYDERDHWHDWFRRKERWSALWKAYVKKNRSG